MARKRALVVDDRGVQAEALAEYLRRRGWEADWVSCGVGAMRKWPLWLPGFVVLDWVLTDCMGAPALLRWMAAQDPPPAVLVLTGLAPEELEGQGLPPGIPVLQKPQEPEAVWRALETMAAARG